jgi:hypothetical protein
VIRVRARGSLHHRTPQGFDHSSRRNLHPQDIEDGIGLPSSLRPGAGVAFSVAGDEERLVVVHESSAIVTAMRISPLPRQAVSDDHDVSSRDGAREDWRDSERR